MARRPSLRTLVDDPATSIVEVALAIDADQHPEMDEGHVLAELATLADPLIERTQQVRDAQELAVAMGEYIHGELGFRGNQSDYYDPDNSYLHRVLQRRLGIPISLTLVWIAMGEQAGIRVEGVGFPGHFLARVGGFDGVLVDPFGGGTEVDDDDLRRLLSRVAGSDAELRTEFLQSVDKRSMTARMLRNLKHIHETRADHASALLVCDRLVELEVASGDVRDRGLHALSLGAPGAAREDFERYLAQVPQAADADEVRAQLARLNRAAGSKPN